MSNGLARASVRARPSAFLGTLAALVLAGTVVTACVAVAVSASGAPASPGQAAVAELGVAFTILTVYLSVFVIAQVMSLAVAQRRRESALLRAVGAAPWQIRRTVAAEALCTALLALPAGYGLGALLARFWWDGMTSDGVLPDGPAPHIGWPPLLAAAGVLLVCSQLGGLAGSWRAARMSPAAALGATSVQGGERAGGVRGSLSVLFLGGACALTVAAGSQGSAADTAAVIPLVLLAHLVAIGLAGPWLGRSATALAAPLLRRCGVAGELAVAGSRARARRLSAAVTPIALVTAFALAKFVSLSGTSGGSGGAWTEVFGTLLYAGFAGLVAANTLVMLTLERLREFSLLRAVGATKRQVVAVVLAECGITAGAGVGAGMLAGCAVMLPLGQRTGTPLSGLPPWAWAATAAAGAVLVVASACAPLQRMLRVRPLQGLLRHSA